MISKASVISEVFLEGITVGSEFISNRSREEIGHELYMLELAFQHNPYPGLRGTYEQFIEAEEGVFVVRPFEPLESRLRSAGANARVHVLSDVDGTLGQEREGLDESVRVVEGIDRAGWQNLMIPIFAEFLMDNTGLDHTTAERMTVEGAEYSMGKPTAVQAGHQVTLCHLNMKRPPLLYSDVPLFDPALLKGKYTRRLEEKVEQRRAVYSPKELRIAGPCELVGKFKESGYRIIFGSGTDLSKIKESLGRLGLICLADEKDIYAAGGILKPWECAKRYIVEMLKQEGVDGRLVISMGDGRPEIYEVYNIGGIALAVATPSICRYNKDGFFTSQKKANGLIEAGATMYLEVDANGGINVQGAMKVIHQGVPERYTRTAKVRE